MRKVQSLLVQAFRHLQETLMKKLSDILPAVLDQYGITMNKGREMSDVKYKLKIWEDPGHAWVEVTKKDFIELEGEIKEVTPYSYQSHNGLILYLEEDCDARYLDGKIKEKYGERRDDHVSVTEEYRENMWIRDLPSVSA